MRTKRKREPVLITIAVVSAVWLTALFSTISRAAGETVLTGRITAASGGPMEGIVISARQFGRTFTTSKTIMMDVRTPEDIAALKAEVQKVAAR